MNIFTRITLWYNGVCPKHLVYKGFDKAGPYNIGELHCSECFREKMECKALKKQSIDDLIVELKRGR